MKQLYLSILAFLFSLITYAQCEAPEIIEWSLTDEASFDVSFFTNSSGTYTLQTFLDYGETDFSYDPQEFGGTASAGLNTINVAIDTDIPNPNILYFSAKLFLECENEESSDTTDFYLSGHSMASDPGFNCQNSVIPLLPFGYFGDPQIETLVPFEVNSGGEIIETMSVFFDIGHSYNGDLALKLITPTGAEIALTETPSGLGGSSGFSVVFTDESSNQLADLQQGFGFDQGPRGFCQPVEPLSQLNGAGMDGLWTLSIRDVLGADDGMVFSTCLIFNDSPCLTSISGVSFYDINYDGVRDETEPSYPYAYIENSISENLFFTNQEGFFWNCLEPGTGTLEILNTPEYYQGSTINISLMENEQLDSLMLAIIPAQLVSDISVDLISLEPNRPGFEADYLVQVRNLGTICEDELIMVDLEFPEYVEIFGSANDDLVITENTATFDVDQVCPFSPFEFQLTILLDDTVSLGSILEATISASVSDTDPNDANNTFTSSVEVVGSYDPNDKQVSTEIITDEFMSTNSPLKYTIRFQNTGTFYAERVVIADTIDANLDINSLQIISTSHNMEISREDNVLYFEFDQIFLPDSTTDFDASMGHVRYTMNPTSSFSEAETIENTAYIYFDFNEPIVTNTVETVYANPLSTIDQVDFDLEAFPNPTSGIITLNYDAEIEVNRIEIYSIDGKKVFASSVINHGQIHLDLSALENGLYIVHLISENREGRVKVIKEAKN